jgi:UDP-N-acetyl-2-amino-2-deoxyglucuronate dehydrogenase
VGILDSYFPDAAFFTEFERFDRHVEMLRRKKSDQAVDYVSIASPNYLHDAHIRFALRVGAHAICEKPLVLNPWNIDALAEVERETGNRIYSIFQLRLHPAIQELKRSVALNRLHTKHHVDLTYVTGRGNWYFYSWKGELTKSGGLSTNIGIHFFDMLTWIFGKVLVNNVHLLRPDRAAGFIELENAYVRWFLSVNIDDLPYKADFKEKRTFRGLTIDGTPLEFTEGFADLHTLSYEEILKGDGYGLDESRRSIEMAYAIRHAVPDPTKGDLHPSAKAIVG